MTLPDERTRAVIYTQQFLRDLLDPKKTPKVPREVRKRAYACLRHYPWSTDVDSAAKLVPSVFGRVHYEGE